MMCVNSGLVELLVEETVAGEALRVMAEVKEEVEKQVRENMDKQQQFRDMFKAMTGQDIPEGVSGMLLDALRGLAEDDSDDSSESDESDDE
ncbi:MAG TPA: hypothetical protein PLW93_05530 [Candidatus Absconditabacterales bacterium]|nr:hypothetical protein [Candidatus Absconditabacterales bacterium]